jgi:hypothetical protein
LCIRHAHYKPFLLAHRTTYWIPIRVADGLADTNADPISEHRTNERTDPLAIEGAFLGPNWDADVPPNNSTLLKPNDIAQWNAHEKPVDVPELPTLIYTHIFSQRWADHEPNRTPDGITNNITDAVSNPGAIADPDHVSITSTKWCPDRFSQPRTVFGPLGIAIK